LLCTALRTVKALNAGQGVAILRDNRSLFPPNMDAFELTRQRFAESPTRLTLLFAVVILALWLAGVTKKKVGRQLPGPPVSWIPIVGNFPEMKDHIGSFPALLEKWRVAYGPIYSYKAFGERTIVLSDPQMVKDVRLRFVLQRKLICDAAAREPKCQV
jgi:hypothetical protein